MSDRRCGTSLCHFSLLALACALLCLGASFQPSGVPHTNWQLDQAQSTVRYELTERIYLTHGIVEEADWLDTEQFITLLLSPNGAAVWRTKLSELPEKFISSQFIDTYLCPPELTERLSWTVSPGKRYLFFDWFLDDGNRQWALIDIGEAPQFRLRKFVPPAGMQIAKILFSPDDRYAILVHDSYNQGCEYSILALDLEAGTEHWRISAQELSFVSNLWWGGAIFDAPRFNAVASLHNGEFLDQPGIARCDLTGRTISFSPENAGLILGSEALWGSVECYAAEAGAEAPYYLRAAISGQEGDRTILLSDHPVVLTAMPNPGLVLLLNTTDWVTRQLWLVNVLAGDKLLIDSDCAGFSLAADGKLLVRAGGKNELRVFELIQPSSSD